MIIDTINKGDVTTGSSHRAEAAAPRSRQGLITDEERSSTRSFNAAGFQCAGRVEQGPRRMGTDKNADVLWVGNSWGNNLTKINTHTMDTSFVSLPGPGVMQPYHVAVDSRHNAWLNIWTRTWCCDTTPPPARGPPSTFPRAAPRRVTSRCSKRREDAGGHSLFAHQQGRGHDVPHRVRSAALKAQAGSQ